MQWPFKLVQGDSRLQFLPQVAVVSMEAAVSLSLTQPPAAPEQLEPTARTRHLLL